MLDGWEEAEPDCDSHFMCSRRGHMAQARANFPIRSKGGPELCRPAPLSITFKGVCGVGGDVRLERAFGVNTDDE